MDLSDRITVLHRGEVLSEGTPEDIADDQAVRDAYLGGMA
jgi:branched-chain amino acid transport system ATP-binding protein